MRNALLFSLALGLTVATVEAKVSKVANPSNLAAATAYSSDRLVQNTVTGTVSDANGPMPGVSVSVVGMAGSTRTDADGKFKITAALGATLRFSSVGYVSQDAKVVGNTLNVVLKEEDNALEEVVVVGYGQQKKAHLTGAVSSIGGDEIFASRPIPDVARGLQGAIPGLSVVVNGGEVGSDPIMKIRGQVGSVNGNSNPLILVDNVEIPSIQFVNPDDVESVTVLKDAASTSIYGSKAAFGVILITTKKGSKTEKTEVTYSNNFILQSPVVKPDMAGIEALEYTVDAHENMKAAGPAGGFWRVNRNSLERIRKWQELYSGKVGATDEVLYNRDWYVEGGQKFGVRLYDPVDLMIKDRTFSHKHNLSLNGRTGNTTYHLGLGYLGQEGMMKPAKHDDYRRLTPTLNISSQVNDYLTVRGGVMYAEGTKRYPNSLYVAGKDPFEADPWLYMYRWSRLFPVGVQQAGHDIFDPVYSARTAPTATDNKKYTSLNLGTTIDVTKNWNIVADYTYAVQNSSLFRATPYVRTRSMWDTATDPLVDENGNFLMVDEEGRVVDSGGEPGRQFVMRDHVAKEDTYVSEIGNSNKRHTLNAFTTYNLNIDQSHTFKFMLGTNIVSYENKYALRQKGEFILNDGSNPQFNYATGTEVVKGDFEWDSQVGFFGRVNYAFKDKYLFEVNLRRDGSSKFPKHLKWRSFPSLSAGWVLTNENFMQAVNPVLSFAKIRGSWGVIGDQSVANNLYIPEMDIKQNEWLTGGSSTVKAYQLGTPPPVSANIRWQDIEQFNIGADLRFFGNKLGVTADWYERNTNDMLVGGQVLPTTYGRDLVNYANTAPVGNYGTLRTRGWELSIDYTHRFESGLRINAMANMADATSVTVKGADWNTPWEDRLLSGTFSTGRRYGDVYGFITDRLYQAEDFMYDSNGDFLTTQIIRDGTSKTMYMLAGENPVYQPYFQDGGPVMMISPGDVKFVDVNGDGYIDNGKGTNGDPGDRVVIGNTTPRYQYGLRLGADFKGFDFSIFVQGVGKRDIWGAGQLAIPGFSAKEGSMPVAIASDYWRADRTDAFYPRAWDLGGSNEGYVMRAQSRYMLDMSYIRIKNITLGYALPTNLMKKIHLSNARIYLSMENMLTFDKLRGLPIDPESISGVSMLRENSTQYNLGRTGTSNPTFRSASMGVQISF